MAHDADPAAGLRHEWSRALVEAGHDQAAVDTVLRDLITHLQRTRGGTELYVPVIGRQYPVAAIREAFARHDSIRSICRRFQIDRRTLYGLLDVEGPR